MRLATLPTVRPCESVQSSCPSMVSKPTKTSERLPSRSGTTILGCAVSDKLNICAARIGYGKRRDFYAVRSRAVKRLCDFHRFHPIVSILISILFFPRICQESKGKNAGKNHIDYDFVTFGKGDNILLTFRQFECILYVDISRQKEYFAWSSF